MIAAALGAIYFYVAVMSCGGIQAYYFDDKETCNTSRNLALPKLREAGGYATPCEETPTASPIER